VNAHGWNVTAHFVGADSSSLAAQFATKFPLSMSLVIYSLHPLPLLSIIRNRLSHTIFNTTAISSGDGKNDLSSSVV
jgi:hypothetical protein